jgi:molecular chaperone GrpE
MEPKKTRKKHSTPAEGQMDSTGPRHPQEELVSVTAADLETMQSELVELRQQTKEYLEGWQRERADLRNYKQRIEREQCAQTQVVTANVVKKYLVVLDDLLRALANAPKTGDAATWAQGIELIVRKLQAILEAEGIQPIPAVGEFDPALHEAITHEDHPELKAGQIIEVVQQGYVIGDRVIRPALVRVAR